MNMGERLEQAIIRSGLTVNAVAKDAGVSAQTLYSIIKRNNRKIDVDIMLRILRVLDISFEYLVEDEAAEQDEFANLGFLELPVLERAIIKAYRVASDKDKTAICLILFEYFEGRADDSAKEAVKTMLGPYIDAKIAPSKEDAEIAAELYVLPEPTRPIPLYELPVSAGSGEFLDSEDYDVVEVGAEVPLSANFGVRISGRSMEPDYPEGHIAWVKRTPDVDVGKIGVFVVDGEGYIKQRGRKELVSLNSAYPNVRPNEYSEPRTCGLVVGVSENVYE